MRLVVRLLDADGHLVGWAEAPGLMPGDGTVVIPAPVTVVVSRAGTVTARNVHWCDLDVNVTVPVDPPLACAAGHLVTVAPGAAFAFASSERALPPVTLGGSVSVGVGVGSLGAVTSP